jgi:hypothetical protein
MNNANWMMNKNMNNNLFRMKNPNMNQLTYNTIGNNMQNSEEKFSRELKLGNEIYIIKVKKIKPSQISIICENKFDYLSLYGYSITLTYDEFCKLGKSFRLYDNIDEIYDTIKNLFKGVDFSFKNEFNMGQNSMMQMNYNQGMPGNMGMNMPSNIQTQSNINMSNNALNSKDSSNVKLENSNNGSINLILKIPLLNEKYEKIKIEFKKENKDIRKQYEKLKNKFLKIKKIVYPDLEEKNTQNNQMNPNSMQGLMGMQAQMGNPMGNSDYSVRTSESILSQIINEFEN